MSLTNKASVADDPAFRRRVRQAATTAALNVASEDPNTANHEKRKAFATAVLTLPNQWAQIIAVGIANNGNVGSGVSDPSVDSTDGDSALEYVMSTVWDAYSG